MQVLYYRVNPQVMRANVIATAGPGCGAGQIPHLQPAERALNDRPFAVVSSQPARAVRRW